MNNVEASESFSHSNPIATACSIAEPVGERVGWINSSGLGNDAHLLGEAKNNVCFY